MGLLAFERHPGDTAALAGSASTLQNKAALCLDQEQITEQAYNPAVDSWDGICAPELREAPEPVRQSAQDANKQLAWSVVPLNYAAGKITGFNTVADRCQADSEVPDPESVEPDGDPRLTNYGQARTRYYEAYETYIVDGFSEAAGMLRDGPTAENIALAQGAGAIPTAPVFTVFGTLWHEDNMTAAATEAEEIAQRILDGTGDQAQNVEDLVALLEQYGTDQMFAAMLLNQLGPEGMLNLNRIIAQSQGDGAPNSYDEDGGPQDEALADLIRRFQESMGTTLGTATGGADGYDPGTRPEYRLDPDFTEQLNELGRERSTYRYPGSDHDYGVELYGYQLLAPLLRTGQFSSDFLTDVGNGMYYFDKTEGENGGGPWMDTVQSLRDGHGIRLDWTQGTGSTHSAGFDPLQALMTALGNNPDASHDFFTGSRNYTYDGSGGHDQEVGYNEKLRYLLNERVWDMPLDQPYLGTGTDERGYYDQDIWNEQNNTHPMDALGAALTAATGGGDQDAATLFGDIVYEVSNGDLDGDKFADLRDDFAEMTSQHIGAVNSAFIGNGGPGTDGDIDPVLLGVQYDPGFSTEDDLALEQFLAEIGRDEDASTHVTAAEGLYMQAGYQHYLGLDGTLDQRIAAVDANVNTPLGHVLGALDYGATEQTWQDHVEADQEFNEGVDTRYGIIGYFADQLPFSKLPIGGDIASMGVDAYLEALQSSEQVDTSDVANQLIGSLHSGSENHVQSTAEMTLYANLSDEDLAQFGDDIPREDDGTPTPISEWTAQDQAVFNEGLRNNTAMSQYFTQFGQDARDAYSQAFDSTKTNLDSH